MFMKVLAFMLLFMVSFLGVVSGDEIRMPPDALNVYLPETMNPENPNLLIGGVGQEGPNPDQNPNYMETANKTGSIYIPTYYSDESGLEKLEDEVQVNYAASWFNTYIYPNGLTYQATYENGLKNNALTEETYNTIIAYSGGTVTAVTALAKQGVKCHTLILISPMRGAPYENPMMPIDPKTALTHPVLSPPRQNELYKEQIEELLDNGAVTRIVVIQSSDDILPFGSYYQARFENGEIVGVDVYNVDLEARGIQAHKDLFSHAKDHLHLGMNGRVYYVPGRILNWITIKRNEINLFGDDRYGHYWIEILDGPDGDPIESYGWWPKDQLQSNLLGFINPLAGVQGELNGITSFDGSKNKDPHHGMTAETQFHPILVNELTDQQVLDKIHEFVRDYHGEWRWTFGGGQNCQTFQSDLMNYVGLEEPDVPIYSSTEAKSWSKKSETKKSLKKTQKM